MSRIQQEHRLADIEKRLRLGIKVFPDDIEFLTFAREAGYTERIRAWADDLHNRMVAAAAAVR